MADIVKRMQMALDHANLSWSGASIKLGLSPQAPQKWKKGQIGRNTAKKLAELTGVSHSWLLAEEGEMLTSTQQNNDRFIAQVQYKPVIAWEVPEDLDENTHVIVPRVDVSFSAGCGNIPSFEPILKSQGMAFLWSWIRQKQLNPKNLFTIDVVGDSMEPSIKNGSVVTLDKSFNTLDQVQSGKVYAIRYGDELRIKRLDKRFDGTLIIKSDNPNYPDELIDASQFEHIGIIGKYVAHSFDGDI